MTNDDFKNLVPRTLRAISPGSVIAIVFCIIAFIGLLYICFNTHMLFPEAIIPIILFPSFIIWMLSIRIVLSFEGISYKSGLMKVLKLEWSDIDAVAANLKRWGLIFDASIILHSGSTSKKEIKIDAFFFRPIDLQKLLQAIKLRSPNVVFDQCATAILEGKNLSFYKRWNAG